MKKSMKGVAIATALMLAGCATQGPAEYIHGTMPHGEKYTMVVHPQSVPDWMLDPDKLKLNWVVKGDVTRDELAAVASVQGSCRLYTHDVRPSQLAAVFLNGVLYAGAGFLGIGLGSEAFAGARFAEYAKYGAAGEGVPGVANGIVTLGGATYTFENCGRTVLDLFPNYGVHILQKSPY